MGKIFSQEHHADDRQNEGDAQIGKWASDQLPIEVQRLGGIIIHHRKEQRAQHEKETERGEDGDAREKDQFDHDEDHTEKEECRDFKPRKPAM